MKQILCPFCKGDYLVHTHIVALDIRAYICPECSAFWKEGVERTAKTHQFFQDFMEKHGLHSDSSYWKYVEKIQDE